jgi:FG-GAP repeat
MVSAAQGDNGAGAVYVSTESSGGWTEQAELTSPDPVPDEAFGFSLALFGTTALIGATNADNSAGLCTCTPGPAERGQIRQS